MHNTIIKSPQESYELMNISKLSRIIVEGDIQRVAYPDRINSIYTSYLSTFNDKKDIKVPGVLTITECNNEFNLIDGQHRYLALKKLFTTTGHDQQICVNILKSGSKEETEQIFKMINNTIPVAEIPTGTSRKNVNDVIKYFTERYPSLFSSATNSHRPHINRNMFEEKISELIAVHPADILIKKLIDLNIKLSSQSPSEFRRKGDKIDQIISLRTKACSKGGVYFGLYSKLECLDNLYNKTFKPRKHINAILRNIVWNMFYPGSDSGQCLFCKSIITMKTCHMAHDISHAKGGEENKDNLYPCCGSCNCSTGQLSYEECLLKLKSYRIT